MKKSAPFIFSVEIGPEIQKKTPLQKSLKRMEPKKVKIGFWRLFCLEAFFCDGGCFLSEN